MLINWLKYSQIPQWRYRPAWPIFEVVWCSPRNSFPILECRREQVLRKKRESSFSDPQALDRSLRPFSDRTYCYYLYLLSFFHNRLYFFAIIKKEKLSFVYSREWQLLPVLGIVSSKWSACGGRISLMHLRIFGSGKFRETKHVIITLYHSSHKFFI